MVAELDIYTKRKYLTVASYVTISRLLMALIGVVLMAADGWLAAFVIIFVAVMLDIIDGKLARKLNEVSKLGVFLDIMVDKIVIICTYLMIGVKIDAIFFYLGLLMIVREYTMDTMRAIAASNNEVIPADRLSKIKGVLFMTAMLVAIGNYVFMPNETASAVVRQLGVLMATIGMTLAYFTLARFFVLHRAVLV
jgi:CDP-diacylglycerol---glycerol-3-phosphate 3-phosphatidyltransferase